MPKVEIDLENLKDAYANGCSDVKKTLERMFPVLKKKGRVFYSDDYWIITSNGGVLNAKEENKDFDGEYFTFGNYFHTKEQAEEVLNDLRAFFKNRQRHFGIID